LPGECHKARYSKGEIAILTFAKVFKISPYSKDDMNILVLLKWISVWATTRRDLTLAPHCEEISLKLCGEEGIVAKAKFDLEKWRKQRQGSVQLLRIKSRREPFHHTSIPSLKM